MANATAQKKMGPASIENNPLFQLSQGKDVPSSIPAHRKSGRIGNLFFEYIQNVQSLRGKVRNGEAVAQYFESLNLMAVDWERGTYTWSGEPMSKTEFLRKVSPLTAAV